MRRYDLNMPCILCGGHVEFPANAIGQTIACPHRAKTITLMSLNAGLVFRWNQFRFRA
jgi:hypothetical protein